ncbi:MAG: hypothetical protein A2Z01_06320 [Betaproteobacteria bacterium RBG_16_58_11]|nr:MAG: hypothetical protein A2Z01_06320 [Betaproteobacteria bacterium RBG_16_58_11]
MSQESNKAVPEIKDPFDTKSLLQEVVKKLSSQALLFSLAVIVILVVAWMLFDAKGIPIVIAILFVFLVATAAYLFSEEKNKRLEALATPALQAVPKSPATAAVSPVAAEMAATGGFDLSVWVEGAGAHAASRDIAVLPGGGAFRLGDKIHVCFKSSRRCYLTLLNIGTSGKLTVLYPNGLHQDNLIQANRLYRIPGDEYGFEYVLQGPAGSEKLIAIATEEKVPVLDEALAQNGGLFRTVEGAAVARDIAIAEKRAASVPSGHRAQASYDFQVLS